MTRRRLAALVLLAGLVQWGGAWYCGTRPPERLIEYDDWRLGTYIRHEPTLPGRFRLPFVVGGAVFVSIAGLLWWAGSAAGRDDRHG